VSTHNFNKRRGINSEIKQFKEQKSEAERFQNLRDERDEAVIQHLLWKLYHIQEKIQTAKSQIDEKNESLTELRDVQTQHEEALKQARKKVASATKAVQKQDKEVKKREKELEEKVSSAWLAPIQLPSDYSCFYHRNRTC
jgi:structural maintenance of chromosome 1